MKNQVDVNLIETCFSLGQLVLMSFLGAIVADARQVFSPIVKVQMKYSDYVSLAYSSVFCFVMKYAGLNSLNGWGFGLYLCLVLGFLNSRTYVEKAKH